MPAALPSSDGGRVQAGSGHAGQRHRDPDAGDDEREDVTGVAGRAAGQGDDPGETGPLEKEAGNHERACADLVGECTGYGGDQERRGRPGKKTQAGPQWGVAQSELEELTGRREDRRAHEELGRPGGGEAGVAGQPEGDHRLGGCGFAPDESDHESDALLHPAVSGRRACRRRDRTCRRDRTRRRVESPQ